MFITEELSKEEIKERIRVEWQVDVDKLESAGDIVSKTNTEWYFLINIPTKYQLIVSIQAIRKKK